MTHHPPLTAIMACDDNGLIGRENSLPAWHCPDDLDHFRRTTAGSTIIMGRVTYDGLPPHVFDSRQGIVVSNRPLENAPASVSAVKGITQMLVTLDQIKPEKAFLIGGADVLHQCFCQNLVGTFILSEIKGTHEGDCYLPEDILKTLRDPLQWTAITRKEHDDFTITTYRNNTQPNP